MGGPTGMFEMTTDSIKFFFFLITRNTSILIGRIDHFFHHVAYMCHLQDECL